MQSARTTSVAIAMYVKVLKRCLKQKDFVAAKQVHGLIINYRMDHNIYVANNLLIVYITCGRLKDAHQVFDELVKMLLVGMPWLEIMLCTNMQTMQ